MKRILAVLLTLALLVCTFASCGLLEEITKVFPDNGDDTSNHVATNMGIGYGYDVLNSPYFESGLVKKRNSILDLSKASALIEKTQQSGSTSGSIYGKTIEEYAKNYQHRVGMGMDTSMEFAVYSVSVGLSFDVSGNGFFEQKISKNEQQMFYTYFDDINTYYFEMKNYKLDTLRGILSDFFVEDVNRESSETKGMSDEDLAKYLMTTYGTHLITGIQMGGRLEFSHMISTSNSEVYEQLKTALDIKYKGGVGGMFNIGVESSEEEKVDQLLKSEYVRSEASIRRFGGMSTGLWTSEELKANYKEWANSLNEDKYQNAVGVAPDGMVALWNLIPEGNNSLVEAMRTLYRQNGLDAYNTNLEALRPTVQGPIEEIDLTPYYDMSSGVAAITLNERFKHPNYDPETGIFMANGRINGCDIERYVFRGMLGLLDDDGVVVNQLIDRFSVCIQSEHNIEIVLENIALRSVENKSVLYLSDKVINKNTVIVTLTSAGEASYFPTGEQNYLAVNGNVPAVDIPNLIITGEDSLEIYGGNGQNGEDGNADSNVNRVMPETGKEAVSAKNLTIAGTGVFKFYGGDGGHGGNGSAYDFRFTVGDYGAQSGGTGGYAISAQKVTIERESVPVGSLLLYGGDGGNGGKGEDGAPASVFLAIQINGGNGGDGGSGGSALFCQGIEGKGSMTCIAGYSGNGGNGGNGGDTTVRESFYVDPGVGGNGGISPEGAPAIKGIADEFGGVNVVAQNGRQGRSGSNGLMGIIEE